MGPGRLAIQVDTFNDGVGETGDAFGEKSIGLVGDHGQGIEDVLFGDIVAQAHSDPWMDALPFSRLFQILAEVVNLLPQRLFFIRPTGGFCTWSTWRLDT